jgi:hypothetical protein
MPAGHFPDFEEVAGMSREEAAPHVGYRTWDIAHLWELVAQGVQETEVPAPQDWPLLFISYKWESDAHNAWVEKLARDLAARGYDVTFDRFAQKERQPPTVPELVSRLVGCNLFVPVLTELYRRRVEVESGVITLDEDSWVFDEWQVALSLAQQGRMKFLGLWRSGPVLPRPFTAENVYDFREDARYSEMLDKVFPPLRVIVVGLRASGTHRAIGPVLRSEADAIIRQLEETGEFEQIGLVKVDR